MSSVHRFLSRREKKPQPSKPHPANPATYRKPDHFGGVFALGGDDSKDEHEKKMVKGVLERLRHYGIDTMVPANVEYALHAPSVQGDGEGAFKLLMLLQETYEGIVRPYNPETKLLGAENRDSVTCYLDALLFAMFARLDSFEAMLYDSFEDIPRKRLAGLLRLWVNILRSGRLITTDVTKHLQDSLAACGWEDAAKLRQQDPSEAFTFITGQLELPLLTLKMDLYHIGREDPHDDHKFVNERLLEVAIPDEPQDGTSIITLEHCLEYYFNNRIEVKRHLNERRNTLKHDRFPGEVGRPAEKESGLHVEVADIGSEPSTPIYTQGQTVASPTETMSSATPSQHAIEKLKRSGSRKRADSIFSQRKVELIGVDPAATEESNMVSDAKGKKLSTRTEVLMPAWQFFKLLPWYTDHMPMSDAQVAAHFSKKRPVLGICLKRYSCNNAGQSTRLDTYVDIPLEIAVPNFVSDDSMQEDGPLVGNFRLMLQSVVCHRGNSVNSGHYICLTRGTAANAHAHHRESMSDRSVSSDSTENEDPWMRFDDLASERISYVDIQQALKQETPYLIFYQVQPIGDDGHSIHDLPSYAEATSAPQSHPEAFTQPEKPYINDRSGSESELVINTNNALSWTDTTEFASAEPGRKSLDTGTSRGRSSFSILDSEHRRASRPSTQAWYSVPSTPSEEKPNSFLAVANKISARRGSRQSKAGSRASSTGPAGLLENTGGGNTLGSRFSLKDLNMTKLLSRGEAGPLAVVDTANTEAPEYNEPNRRSDASGVARTDEGHGVSEAGTTAAPSKPVSRPKSGPAYVPNVIPAHINVPPTSRGKDKAAVREGKKRARDKHSHEDRDCVLM